MSNPTRAEVAFQLKRHEADVERGDAQFFICQCAICHFGRGCLRAHDLQDAVAFAVGHDDEGVPNCPTYEEAEEKILEALAEFNLDKHPKFGEAGDERKHDPAGEWAGGRTR